MSEKPTPRLWRKTPVVGSTRWEPKSRALDCVSEIPRPSASRAQRCVVSPSPIRATAGPVVPRPGATSGGPPRQHAHPRAGGGQEVGIEQCATLGAVEEDLGAVVADGAPRLDEEVGPRAGPRDRCPAPLPPRRGRRPASGSPAMGAVRSTGRDPRRRAAVVRTTVLRWRRGPPGHRARCRLEQAPPELAGVERTRPSRAMARRVRPIPGHTDALADFQWAVGAQFARSRQRVDEMAGQGQHDRGGEAFLGQLDRRRQDLRRGSRPSGARAG